VCEVGDLFDLGPWEVKSVDGNVVMYGKTWDDVEEDWEVGETDDISLNRLPPRSVYSHVPSA
jgi:hypothetical protein